MNIMNGKTARDIRTASKANEISEYAKIIGICDSYEAMTHNRPHRKATAQYLSVLELADTKDHVFCPPYREGFSR